MKRRRWHIIAVLSFWNSMILLIVLTAAFAALYMLLRQQAFKHFEDQLDRQLNVITEIIRISDADMYDLFNLGQDEKFMVTVGDSVVYVTEGWQSEVYPVSSSWRGPALTSSATPPEDPAHPPAQLGRMRLKQAHVAGYPHTVHTARDSAPLNAELHELQAVFLSSIPFAFLVLVGASVLLARVSLRPVREITRLAAEIDAFSLSKRLPQSDVKDDLSRLVQVMNRMLDRLESSFYRLKRFTADASHELRTPLTSMKIQGEVALRRENDEGSAREVIASLMEDVEHMARLVDELLFLARQEEDVPEKMVEKIDLNLLINQVLQELSILAEQKEQSIHFDKTVLPDLAGKTDTLKLAITNAVHNAIRYTPENGTIQITASTVKDMIQVCIDDSGPGIPPEHREKVLERFYRVDSGRSRGWGGSGLGLAIAHSIVEKHNGTIQIDNSPSGGCRVIMLFPAAGSMTTVRTEKGG